MSAADEMRQAAELLREGWPSTEVSAGLANALADWLEATARRVDDGRPWRHGGRNNHSWRGSREALRVARVINGGAS